MKYFIFIIFFFFNSYNSKASDIAIDAVKAHEKIIHFLADKSPEHYNISYQQLALGGTCGFVGCDWRKLVSLVVTSKSSNAPSITFLALVKGSTANISLPPTVTFMTLAHESPNNLVNID